jgi:Flp pilus assembly pilin Flp
MRIFPKTQMVLRSGKAHMKAVMKSFDPVRRRPRSLRREERGAAAVELAVVLPVLILMAIGAVEFGRVYFTAIRVANAATAGAQFGAQGSGSGDPDFIRQVARDDADDQTLVVDSDRTCRCPDSETPVACSSICAGYGNPQFFIRVTASKDLSLLFGYPGLPPAIPVSRTATVRVQ